MEGASTGFLTLHQPRGVLDGRWLNCSLTSLKPTPDKLIGLYCADLPFGGDRPDNSHAILKPIWQRPIRSKPTVIVGNVLGKVLDTHMQFLQFVRPEYAAVLCYEFSEHAPSDRERNVEASRWVVRECNGEFDCRTVVDLSLIHI